MKNAVLKMELGDMIENIAVLGIREVFSQRRGLLFRDVNARKELAMQRSKEEFQAEEEKYKAQNQVWGWSVGETERRQCTEL